LVSGHKITSFPRRLFYLMDKSYAFKRTHQLTLVDYLFIQKTQTFSGLGFLY
jgi:hypothetical protein